VTAPAQLAPALIVLPILGLALPLARLSGRGAGTAIFQSVSLLTLLQYAFGLAGGLRPGSLLLGLGATGLLLFELSVRPRPSLRVLLSPAAILLVAIAVAHVLAFCEARYAFWDEFDQWGLATRELVLTDALYDLGSNVSRTSAPPAAAVWHYFVCRNLFYSEGATYTANLLLFVAPLLPLYDGLRRRPLAWSVAISALLVFVIASFSPGAGSVMVDHLLASFFAGLLVVHLSDPDDARGALLFVAPACVLTLLKESGLFLALCAAAFVPFHQLVAHGLGPGALRRLLRSGLLLLVPLLAVASWQLRLASLEGPAPSVDVWSVPASLLSGTDEDVVDRAELRARMLEVFLAQPLARSAVDESFNESSYRLMDRYPPGPGTAGWLGLSLGFSALAWLAVRDRRVRIAIVTSAVFLLAVLAAYLVLLMDVYATDFGEVGSELPGYVRYVSTIVLPMVLLPLAMLLPVLSGGGSDAARDGRRLLVAFAVALALHLLGRPYLPPLLRAREQPPFARVSEPWTRRVLEATGRDGRIWVSYPHAGGFMPVIVLRYQLAPLRASIQFVTAERLGRERLLGQIVQSDFVWLLRTGPALEAALAGFAPERLEPLALYRVRHEGTTPDPEAGRTPALELLRSGEQIEGRRVRGPRAGAPGPD
jgi:hypothetical protein